jgi:hypothetical protein
MTLKGAEMSKSKHTHLAHQALVPLCEGGVLREAYVAKVTRVLRYGQSSPCRRSTEVCRFQSDTNGPRWRPRSLAHGAVTEAAV